MHVEYITVVAVVTVLTSVGTTAVLAARGRGPIGVAPRSDVPDRDASNRTSATDAIAAGYGGPEEN